MPEKEEFLAIRKLLHDHMLGYYTANFRLLDTTVYPTKMTNDEIKNLDIEKIDKNYQELVSEIICRTGEMAHEFDISYIHVAGKSASAYIVEENNTDQKNISHFQLLKIANDWKIINRHSAKYKM